MMPGKARKHIVQTTLNDREYALFCQKAEMEGMSMAGWARVLIVRGCRPLLDVPNVPAGTEYPQIPTAG